MSICFKATQINFHRPKIIFRFFEQYWFGGYPIAHWMTIAYQANNFIIFYQRILYLESMSIFIAFVRYIFFYMTGNIFLHLSRLAVGVVFIFSGFVKAIDPYGFSYKIQDYLTSFGSGFQKFNSLAFGAAIALSTFEFLIGLNLVFQIHLKRTTILAFLFMLVMLPLTLYIALFNPVTDCGCFGEALVISNWATFYKNVVLIALIILIWLFNNRFRKIFMTNSGTTIAAISTPSGTGGIAVIRVSGEKAFEICESVYLPYDKSIILSKEASHTLSVGKIISPENEFIDEVVVSVFRAPHSYTGENTIEISCHDLNPDQVRTILQTTSISDTYTGTIPAGGSNTWGFGKIDAWNGIKKCISLASAVDNVSADKEIILYPNPCTDNFSALFTAYDSNVKVTIFAINGQQVMTKNLGTVEAAREEKFDINQLPKGVYMVSITGNNHYKTYKILKK